MGGGGILINDFCQNLSGSHSCEIWQGFKTFTDVWYHAQSKPNYDGSTHNHSYLKVSEMK